MLDSDTLLELAKSRYSEAKALQDAEKPDGAIYLCGYAVELMLKRKIANLLDWDGYPETRSEFEGKQSFRIHNLDMLLHFSGLERKLKSDSDLFAKWNVVGSWNSEIRYERIGGKTVDNAQVIIESAKSILNFILKNT